jgi:hypothetical protein
MRLVQSQWAMNGAGLFISDIIGHGFIISAQLPQIPANKKPGGSCPQALMDSAYFNLGKSDEW